MAILGIHGVRNYRSALLAAAAATSLPSGCATSTRRSSSRCPAHRDCRLLFPPAALPCPAEYEAIAAWARALGIDPAGATQKRLLAPARWIADAVAARFGLDQDLTRAFVVRFFREVVTYLHTLGVHHQVTGLVADTRLRIYIA